MDAAVLAQQRISGPEISSKITVTILVLNSINASITIITRVSTKPNEFKRMSQGAENFAENSGTQKSEQQNRKGERTVPFILA